MGKISKGILGPVSGTVGTVVGANWKGISYLRSKANRSKRVATIKQEQQRAKFALAVQFTRPLGGLFKQTFGRTAGDMTGTNSALSYIIKNAIIGNFLNYDLDYSKILVSRGGWMKASKPAAVVNGSLVSFSWENNSGNASATANDSTVLVVYCPALKQAVYSTSTTVRSEVRQDIDVTQFKGQDVHTYIAFIAADGKDVSDSIYINKLTIS